MRLNGTITGQMVGLIARKLGKVWKMGVLTQIIGNILKEMKGNWIYQRNWDS